MPQFIALYCAAPAGLFKRAAISTISPRRVTPCPNTVFSQVIERIANMPQAVIAAVRGPCYTGAFELALAADIILAAESARFADTHAKFALTPLWGMSQRLPRRIGPAKAREMIFTARAIPADEALSIGLVNHVYTEELFAEAVMALVESIAANSPFSIAAYKRIMADTDGLPIRFALAPEIHNNEGRGSDMAARMSQSRKGARKTS